MPLTFWPSDVLPSLPTVYDDYQTNRCSVYVSFIVAINNNYRRCPFSERTTSYSQPNSNLMPETHHAPRYNYTYSNDAHSARGFQAPYRQTYSHPTSSYWSDSLNSYVSDDPYTFSDSQSIRLIALLVHRTSYYIPRKAFSRTCCTQR